MTRLHEVLSLAQDRVYYIDSLGRGCFDVDQAKDNVAKIMHMKPTKEELDYIKPTNGFSLLHLAITHHNSYLAALFIFCDLDVDLPATGGITPRKLIERIGHLTPEMEDAFYYPEQLLQEAGFIGDSDPVENIIECIHFIDVPIAGDQVDRTALHMGEPIDL